MIARTAPMGWNSWNTFGANISDALVREMADAMVEKGYRDAGYEYLVIDDCWSLRERGADGRLVPDPEKFPHGMKAVADYVHSKGLKFGMYSCAGVRTCAGYPASFDHEFVDAATFADEEGFTCYDMETADYRGILFNFQNEYWQENRDLIPAVCYAIDREAIIDAVLLGQGMAAYGPLQRNIYNYEDVEHYDYDPEKARAVLEAAGCVLGEDGFYTRNGETVGFVISVGAGDQVRIDMAQIVAQQLREIGMDVTVDIPAQVDWSGQMAYLIGWGSPFDADDHTYKVFGTDKGANYSGYSNADVDRYLTEARESDDPAVRAEAYANFQKALAADPAFAFICYIDANYVADASITGIDADTVMGHHGVGIFWNVAEWTID